MRRIDCANALFWSARSLLFTQHGNALLAFLLRSNIAHDAIDSDGVAPLVEAFDYDCSLAGFHGESMHVKS